MKKRILLMVLVVIGVAFLLAFSGCKYKIKKTNGVNDIVKDVNVPVVKDSKIQLLTPVKQWVDIYGDSYESQVNFNIAVLNARVNKLTADVNSLTVKPIKPKGK